MIIFDIEKAEFSLLFCYNIRQEQTKILITCFMRYEFYICIKQRVFIISSVLSDKLVLQAIQKAEE